MIDPYEGLATRFIAHYDTLRGAAKLLWLISCRDIYPRSRPEW